MKKGDRSLKVLSPFFYAVTTDWTKMMKTNSEKAILTKARPFLPCLNSLIPPTNINAHNASIINGCAIKFWVIKP